MLQSQTFSSMLNRSSSTLNSLNLLSNANLKTVSRHSINSSMGSSFDSSQTSAVSSAVPVSLNQFTNRNSRPRFRATIIPEQNPNVNFISRRSVSLMNHENVMSYPNRLDQNNLQNVSNLRSASTTRFENNLGSLPHLGDLEKAILGSQNPIPINETEEIMVNNTRGIWANRFENLNWRGPIPLNQYQLKQDPNPELIRKKPTEKVKYIQEINVRYLNPPEIPKPGDIVIRHEPSRQIPPAPPLIIRQNRQKPPTPPPLIIREEPPKTPDPIPQKVITIPGRIIPPPPRKLVIEKLPEIPEKPQSIYIERWLPYKDIKRRVIYQKPTQPEKLYTEPKNLIVNWEKPEVEVVQEFKFLGIVEANPSEYRQKFSQELKSPSTLPEFVHRINPPDGIVLAAQKPNPKVQLEGDLEALKSLDLEKLGLTEYRNDLNQFEVIKETPNVTQDSLELLLNDLFRTCDVDNDGLITIYDAQNIILHLSNRFGITFNQKDAREFFTRITTSYRGYLTLDEFTKAFEIFFS